MRRERSTPRPDWRRKIEEQGLVFGTPATGQNGARPYWDESVHYVFEMDEILSLEADVELLHSMCLDAVDNVILTERYRDFGIAEWIWPAIAESWKRRDPHVYGRFDLRYDGSGPAKLLEYNADTPTSLLEALSRPVVLEDRRVPGRRPVELHPREAGRALDRDRQQAARRPGALHLLRSPTAPARTTSPSPTCSRPPPRPG